ncbi:MAG: MFS transporter [Promethearchaeota archaeon]
MTSANPHEKPVLECQTTLKLVPNEELAAKKQKILPNETKQKKTLRLKPARDWRKYTTPDFSSMTSIVFWNSLGFFFFGFIIRYATDQLMHASGTVMGIVFAGQTVGGLISTPLVGYLTDRVSKKKLVLVGSFGRGIALVIMYLGICINNLIVFGAGIFIQGLMVGYFWVPLNTLIAQKSHKTVRSAAFGQQAGAMGKGTLIGSILTILYFWGAISWVPTIPWLVYAPLVAYCGFNFYAGVIFNKKVDEHITFDEYIRSCDTHETREILKEEENEKAQEKLLKDTTNFKLRGNQKNYGMILGITFFLITFTLSAVNQSMAGPFLQVFLTGKFFGDIHTLEVALLVMLIYFPSEVISQLIAPKLGELADRFNASIAIIAIGSLGALVTYILININSAIAFGAVLLVDTTCAWGSMLVLQNLMSRFSKKNRGKIFGARQWFSFIGAIIGPILGGYVWDNLGHKSPFIISIFVELALIPFYLVAIKMLHPYMQEKV